MFLNTFEKSVCQVLERIQPPILFKCFIPAYDPLLCAGQLLCLLITTRIRCVTLADSLNNASSLPEKPLRLFMKAPCSVISGVLWIRDEDWCTLFDLLPFALCSSQHLTNPLYSQYLPSLWSLISHQREREPCETERGKMNKVLFCEHFSPLIWLSS